MVSSSLDLPKFVLGKSYDLWVNWKKTMVYSRTKPAVWPGLYRITRSNWSARIELSFQDFENLCILLSIFLIFINNQDFWF